MQMRVEFTLLSGEAIAERLELHPGLSSKKPMMLFFCRIRSIPFEQQLSTEKRRTYFELCGDKRTSFGVPCCGSRQAGRRAGKEGRKQRRMQGQGQNTWQKLQTIERRIVCAMC